MARVRECKIRNRAEFTTNTKNSNTPCTHCIDKNHYTMLLSTHVTGCSFLVRFNNFNNFAWTTGFYWSYMLLLKPPVLMRSWTIVYKYCITPSNRYAREVMEVPIMEANRCWGCESVPGVLNSNGNQCASIH